MTASSLGTIWDESARPRRRPGVELRVIESPREGTRHVLKDTTRGRYLELRGGERDAGVWERLDGTRSLREISLEIVEATGSFPRDLGRFVARLDAEGFLDLQGRPEPRLKRRPGRFLIPVPGAGALLSVASRVVSFLARPTVFFLAATSGIAGALIAPRLALRGTLFPRFDDLPALASLLAVNAALALLEALARAAVITRKGGQVSHAGIAFGIGAIPEPAVDPADESVIPVEGRALSHVAPLAVSLFIGGSSAIALYALRETGNALDPRAALAAPWLLRAVWIGLIRALVHANPLGPGALHGAISAWFHIDDLDAATSRYLAHDLVDYVHGGTFERHGLARREQLLVAHAAASVVWLVLAARTFTRVATVEVLPRIEVVPATGPWRALAQGLALLFVVSPLALIAWPLVAGIARAFARSVGRSALGQPHGAGIGAAIFAAVLGAAAIALPPLQSAVLAAATGAVATWLALKASATDGRGRAAISFTFAALATALAAFSILLVADMGRHHAAVEAVLRVVAGTQRACGLALVAAALVEVSSAARTGSSLAKVSSVGAAVLAVGCLGETLVPGLLEGIPGLFASGPVASLAAALLYAISAFQSLGAHRPASRFVLAFAALALSVEQAFELADKIAPLEPLARALAPATREIWAQALAAFWPGLIAAASLARMREQDVRSFALPLDLVEPSATEDEVLAATLAPLAETVREHLGQGAALFVGREVARSTGRSVEERALVALRSVRAVAGERYLSRYLEAALERVPNVARAALAKKLEPVSALAHLSRQIMEGAEPDLARRGGLFRGVPVLSPLPDDDVFELASLAVFVKVPAGRDVVREGEEGDRFYVIARGEARVSVQGKDGIERTVAHLHECDAFGEAALLRHEPRAGTVRAESDLELLAVGRDVFLEFVKRRKELLVRIVDRLEDVWLLRSTALFAELESAQVSQLFQRCFDVSVEPGTAIVRQGERGDRFYIVREGEVSVEVDDKTGKKRTVAVLGRGDYFGEMALLHDAPRAATVVARTPVELVGLGREDFLRLMRGEARLRLEKASQDRARAPDGGAA